MVIAPSLYAVLAYERFYSDAVLPGSGETCILFIDTISLGLFIMWLGRKLEEYFGYF